MFPVASIPHRSPSAPFSPLALSPAIWLDASQEAYANNASVGTAHDWSGNARDFTEATNKPLFLTGIYNGKPSFYFDGTKQLNRSYTGSGSAFTIAGVVEKTDAAFRVWYANGIDPYFGINANGCPNFFQGSNIQNGSISLAGANLMGVRSNAGTTQVLVGKNILLSGSTTSSALKVSGLSNLGGFQWKGHIAEAIAKGAYLSDADWSAYADYVTAKYGLLDRRILMCDGDSITYGSGASDLAHSWAGLVNTSLGNTRWIYVNTGISGQTVGDCSGGGGPSEWMLKSAATSEWQPAKRTSGYNVLTGWGLTNDLFYGASAATAYASYASYLSGAKAAGFKVIAFTCLDRATSGGSWTRAAMQAANTSIRSNWANYADALIDPIALDSRFDDHTSALFADGIHPNDAGHAIIAAAVISAITGL